MDPKASELLNMPLKIGYAKKPPDTSWMAQPIKLNEILNWQYQIPSLAKERWTSYLDSHQIDRWARASKSLDEFSSAITEDIYAANARLCEDDTI